MTVLLTILVVVAALATLFVLIRGVIGMVNASSSPQRSQDLMRKRVMFQAVAILLAVLLLLIAGGR